MRKGKPLTDLSEEERESLEALEETLWRVETRYDPEVMDRTFAAEFVEVGRSGRRFERSEILFEPDPEAAIDASLPLPDYCVVLIAPDVALATYTSEVRHRGDLERGRRSSLWTKVQGRWQLRFHQGTPC